MAGFLLVLLLLAVVVHAVRDEGELAELAISAQSARARSSFYNNTSDGGTSAPDFIDECFITVTNKKFIHYIPPHMQGQPWTREESHRYCQHRCRATMGCKFFAWKKHSKKCYLQSRLKRAATTRLPNRRRRRRRKGWPESAYQIMYGPSVCRSGTDAASTVSCYNLNIAYDRDLNGEPRQVAETPHKCLQRCQETPFCKYYSWYLDGGCHIHPGDAVTRQVKNAVSGPALDGGNVACSECLTAQQQRTGKEFGEYLKVETQEACRDHCAGLGCEHFTFWSEGGCRCYVEGSETKESEHAVSGPVNCPVPQMPKFGDLGIGYHSWS